MYWNNCFVKIFINPLGLSIFFLLLELLLLYYDFNSYWNQCFNLLQSHKVLLTFCLPDVGGLQLSPSLTIVHAALGWWKIGVQQYLEGQRIATSLI